MIDLELPESPPLGLSMLPLADGGEFLMLAPSRLTREQANLIHRVIDLLVLVERPTEALRGGEGTDG